MGKLQQGDLILAIDGKDVENAADYARLIGDHKVGDKVKLTIERGEKRFDVEATLRGV